MDYNRDMAKVHSKESVYSYLQSHAVGVLSTISAENLPDASPIYFVTDNELNFFFLTKSHLKKSLDIDNNNHAALTVVDAASLITIQATGTVKEVENPEMYEKLAEVNAQEKGGLHWPPPLHKLHHSGDLLMYQLTPDWLRVADFSESEDETNITNDVFHEIISHSKDEEK